jgi:hypothetical protein
MSCVGPRDGWWCSGPEHCGIGCPGANHLAAYKNAKHLIDSGNDIKSIFEVSERYPLTEPVSYNLSEIRRYYNAPDNSLPPKMESYLSPRQTITFAEVKGTINKRARDERWKNKKNKLAIKVKKFALQKKSSKWGTRFYEIHDIREDSAITNQMELKYVLTELLDYHQRLVKGLEEVINIDLANTEIIPTKK